MPQSPTIWVRTRVTPTTKNKVRQVAGEMGWNIPGVECACIELAFLLFTPSELVELIQRALSPEVEETDDIIEP